MTERSGSFGLSRRERILNELRRTGEVHVSTLAHDFGVTDMTVRRDIQALADAGLATRVHGGATLRSELDTTTAVHRQSDVPMHRVGIVVPSLDYYWPQVILGARSAAPSKRIQLVLRGASYTVEDQRRQIESLVTGNAVHGLIVAPEVGGDEGQALLEWLNRLPIPVVLVERRAPADLELSRLEWVATDHALGGELALRYLARQGHRRLGIMTWFDSPTSGPLRKGWRRAARDLDLPIVIDEHAPGNDQTMAGRIDVFKRLLTRARQEECTAMLVHNDPQAILLQQAATDAGMHLPDDLAIMAYDDEVAEGAELPLTALRPAKEHVGRRSVEVIAARLEEGRARPVERLHIVPELRERASTPSLLPR